MRVTVDGKAIEVNEGATVLEACEAAGYEVPTLCYLRGRPAQASCFVCVVRIEGRKRLAPSCATRAEEGMQIEADSAAVRQARKVALELLLSDHVGDCLGPCQSVCPAHMDIPDMIRHIQSKDFRSAISVVKQAIALPAVLGRVCPELCEKGCRRKQKDGPVAICRLKRFVADQDLASDSPYKPEKAEPTGKKVAVIGAGPAGLAAGFHLAILGHEVHLFDREPSPGGALRTAISRDVLPEEILDAEIATVLSLGVTFHGDCAIDGDEALQQLRSSYQAVILCTGPASAQLFPSLGSFKPNRETLATSLPGVFAAGAVTSPTQYAVRSVADGKRVALSVDAFLRGETWQAGREFSVHVGKMEAAQVEPYLQLVSSKPRNPSTEDFSVDEAVAEAERCLRCACTTRNDCRLRRFSVEYGASTSRFQGERRAPEIDASHPDLIFEPGKCISCGICVRIAQEEVGGSGLAYVGRGFDMRIGAPLGDLFKDAIGEAAARCAEACPTSALVLKSWLEGEKDA